jgi:hypothetical protein
LAAVRDRYHDGVTRSRAIARPLLVVLVALSACELVDPGDPVGVPKRCAVGEDFFVAEIWPNYILEHDCTNAGCHDEDGPSVFKLVDVSGELAPLAGDPVSAWPEGWRSNYERTASQITDCDIAELSPLYSKPAGGDNTMSHAGGEQFGQGGDELDLIQEWLSAP